MTMQKKQIEKRLSQVERKFQQVLMEKRLEWLQRVCKEAKAYDFGSLGELIVFMVNHAGDIQLKSDDTDIPARQH